MNTITIELCAEDRARLDNILEALSHHDCSRCANDVAKYVVGTLETAQEPAEAPEPIKEETAQPEPEVVAPATEEPAEKPVSKADIQRKVVELSAAGKKAQVREIVTAYAVKVSDIPEDKTTEVWNKLTALEG